MTNAVTTYYFVSRSYDSALKELIAFLVRNDHQARPAESATLFQFAGNGFGLALCGLQTWQDVSHIIKKQF